jgi:F-type H+-transporting ATPase subunit epsilon
MYTLSILTSEKTIFSNEVQSIIVPGKGGYLEILSHHAPLIALIQSGKLDITMADNKKRIYAISSGLLEVSNNQATIFTDGIELISK